MAAAGYMTRTDVQSIWKTTIDNTRFAYINVRFGEILNAKCRKDKDSQTDITETKVLPLLEQISEEGLFQLISAAKITGTNNPWNFIQANILGVMSKVLRNNRETIDEIKEVLEAKLIVKYSNLLNLPSHSD